MCERVRCALVTAFAHHTSQNPIRASRLLAYPPAGDLPRASETSNGLREGGTDLRRWSLARPINQMRLYRRGGNAANTHPVSSPSRPGMTGRQARKVERRCAEQMPPPGVQSDHLHADGCWILWRGLGLKQGAEPRARRDLFQPTTRMLQGSKILPLLRPSEYSVYAFTS